VSGTVLHLSSHKLIGRITGIPPAFTIRHWPVLFDQARVALMSMQDSHSVNFLNAFDVDNLIIPPQNYRCMLERAVVKVVFTLKHWEFYSKGENGFETRYDEFAADVVKIVVLRRPGVLELQGNEGKKFVGYDVMIPSSKKQRRHFDA
jgi:hypothetical protein